jgi:hypothetical protein
MLSIISRSIGYFIFLFLLTACINQEDKTHDCKEYVKAIQKIGEQAASNLQVFPLQSKDGYIQLFSSMADGEQENARIFQSMKLQNSQSKEIQNEIVEIIEKIGANQQDKKKIIESALKPLQTSETILMEKLSVLPYLLCQI